MENQDVPLYHKKDGNKKVTYITKPTTYQINKQTNKVEREQRQGECT
jgi:hypothetical protein